MALSALQGLGSEEMGEGELGGGDAGHSTALPYWSTIEAKMDPNPSGGLIDRAAHTKQAMDAMMASQGGAMGGGQPKAGTMRPQTNEYGMPIEDDVQAMASLGLV